MRKLKMKNGIFILSVALVAAWFSGRWSTVRSADCRQGYELMVTAKQGASVVKGKLRISPLSQTPDAPLWRWEWQKGGEPATSTVYVEENGSQPAKVWSNGSETSPALLEAVWLASVTSIVRTPTGLTLHRRDTALEINVAVSERIENDPVLVSVCKNRSGKAALTEFHTTVVTLPELQRDYVLTQSSKTEKIILSNEDRKTVLSQLLQASESKEINAAIVQATLALRSYPELTRSVLGALFERLATAPRELDMKAVELIGVLGGAHTPQSEAALGSFIDRLSQDRSDSHTEYLEAAIRTLHLPHTPSLTMVRRLEGLTKSSDQSLSTQQAALLALGTMVGQLPDSEMGERVFQEMVSGANGKGETAAAYLSALANTGDPRVKEILLSASQRHPSSLVRRHAENELKTFQPSSI